MAANDNRKGESRRARRVGLHRLRAGAPAAAPSARRARAADRRPQGRAGDARRCFRSSRRSSCRRWSRSKASTGPRPASISRSARCRTRPPRRCSSDLLAKAPNTKVVDLSADFRLHDPAAYAKWYGHEHHAPELQKEAVYGLVEIHREAIKKARLVANPGCYTSCAQLAVTPLLKAKAIEPDEIVIDAKSGMTGAGGPPRRRCCSPRCRKASTPMASATTGTWPSSTRSSRSPPAARWS